MDSKILFIIGLTVFTVATGFYMNGMKVSSNENEQTNIQYTMWKKEFNRKYAGAEDFHRYNIFSSNMQIVQEHNLNFAAGLVSFDMGLNNFADLTVQEYAAKYLTYSSKSTTQKDQIFTGEGVVVDSHIDWSVNGAVTPVKNQGSCGSCWAFSTTGAIEAHQFNKTQGLISLSEQELVDCAGGKYQNEGCNGGLMDLAFQYVIENGLYTNEVYPYNARDGVCQNFTESKYQIQGFTDVLVGSQLALEAAITLHPVSVAIDASSVFFQLYKSGVFKRHCSTTLNHAVLAVGLDTLNGDDYYKVKNSWGTTWGDKGYIKMARIGDGHGQCGIQDSASFPI